MVVGFDHHLGSTIEWCHPQLDDDFTPDIVKRLTFIALPDGSHSATSDFSYFVLCDAAGRMYYGVSVY